ncbi:hypothetical protein POSPLADRAFT_1049107 [Postia placenta MAD-698-R-SB12]|uniref:Uncharacterized protein n=1 Tax=Postia placenta MAD-698-R-SB12 TaxID=670580 RepID=A0A1X6MRY4_9APHY|nr:hypothetical protein POSPLADRAFT_1049107 [Postia placenta MAD-698-R-SB12]OSX58943.1 hypothetical protein POSPLADRAFT_1049107 [Postia placenta MAD-698-R-SB12]
MSAKIVQLNSTIGCSFIGIVFGTLYALRALLHPDHVLLPQISNGQRPPCHATGLCEADVKLNVCYSLNKHLIFVEFPNVMAEGSVACCQRERTRRTGRLGWGNVPPGTVQIVLKFQSEETEQLRRRLRAAEGWSKDCNASLAAEVARLTRESANAQTLIQQWEGSFTQTSQLPQNEVESNSLLPICSPERSINKLVKALVPVRSITVVLMFPSNPKYFRCANLADFKGNWNKVQNKKLLRDKMEFVAYNGFEWKYLGTFTSANADSEELSREAFIALPDQTREQLIRLSGHKRHRTEVKPMYESGEMVGMKFSFRRIGFNHALGEMLRGVGKVALQLRETEPQLACQIMCAHLCGREKARAATRTSFSEKNRSSFVVQMPPIPTQREDSEETNEPT